MKKCRRRQYWVDKNVQKPFTKTVLFAAITSGMGGAVIAFHIGAIAGIRASGTTDYKVILDWLVQSHVTNLLLMSVSLAIVLGIISCYAVVSSNKIAGPMVPIKRGLKGIREGDFSKRISIRKDDWLHDLVDDLNRTFNFIEEQQEDLMKQIRELTESKKDSGMGNQRGTEKV